MAEITRRTWANLQTEHTNRMGRVGDTDYAARSKEFLSAAYYDICTRWHHFELDTRDTATLTCSTGTNVVSASALGLHGIFGVQLRSPTIDTVVSTLSWEEAHFSLQKYKVLQRMPESYSRYGNDLVFPVIPDAAYPVTIHYYANPTPPDFDTPTSSELAREWDEHILELSLALAHGALWQADLSGYYQDRFDKWSETVTNPLLVAVPMHGRPESQTRSFPHGGAQG